MQFPHRGEVFELQMFEILFFITSFPTLKVFMSNVYFLKKMDKVVFTSDKFVYSKP